MRHMASKLISLTGYIEDSAAFDCVPSFTLLKDTTTNATDVGSLFVLAQANAATYKGESESHWRLLFRLLTTQVLNIQATTSSLPTSKEAGMRSASA